MIAGLLLSATMIAAQDSSTVKQIPKAMDSAKLEVKKTLLLSAYVEAYYGYDFNRPSGNSRPGFLYSHNRHNEFNINLAFLKANYSEENVRGNIAIAVGTYMNANYAAEPGVLKNVLEANAGIKILKSANLWFDIGILPSHIGFESAVGKDNWTLTRSLVAENSPYFESGAKLTYSTKDNRLLVSAMALNGWQRITRVDGNSLVSFGTQLTYKASDALTLNYSTFFGSDKPDSARLRRSYHNIYGIFNPGGKVGVTAGFDIGFEQRQPGKAKKNEWYTPVVIVRIAPSQKVAVAIRGEYFKDANNVIITTANQSGFRATGLSANVDYSVVNNSVLRLELRNLNSQDPIFTRKDGGQSKSSTSVTFSMAIWF